MRANGSDIQRLTYTTLADVDEEHFPGWSPDGAKIAFMYGPELNHEIYVMNADGSNRVNLTNHPADDWAPVWSPDGSKIAFHSFFRTESGDIFVMDANGEALVRLTTDPGEDSFPVWSPDGQRIAFVSNRRGNHEIYVMRSDGSNQIPITQNGANNQTPSWSPDGNRIAFASLQDSRPNELDPRPNLEIYTISADGFVSSQIRLTNNRAIDAYPRWSPNCRN